MERRGVIAAGNMLVDHVHQIVQWPERGWLAEIIRSERATGGAPLNVLLTLAKMHTGLPLQAVGLIGQDECRASFIKSKPEPTPKDENANAHFGRVNHQSPC